jgi:4-hydroxy-3-methylbut-2-en-1-yl diphosphate reductase
MKINLADSAGFCFGVKRALKIALESTRLKRKIFMLGDIVHNEDVVREIRAAGINKIARLSQGKGKILLIRAHGAGTKTLSRAALAGYEIIDATCPMVKEIHRIAREMEDKGYRILIIGDKNHDEVRGIIGQLQRKAIVIDGFDCSSLRKIGRLKKACVVVQSTQNLDKVASIVSNLRPLIKDLKFFNTICRPTRMKQAEIRKMPLQNDAMVIIGSKASANTRRLYEISKALNPRTYWVTSKQEIKRDWFRGLRSVGVTAGASTPDTTTQETIRYLKTIS